MFLIFDDTVHKDITATDYVEGKTGNRLTSIGPLSKMNIFIGENNSGKSRMLRGLLRSEDVVLSSNPSFRYLVDRALETDYNIPKSSFRAVLTVRENTRYEKRGFFIDRNHEYLYEYAKENNQHITLSLDGGHEGKLKSEIRKLYSQKEYSKLIEFTDLELRKLKLITKVIEGLSSAGSELNGIVQNSVNLKLVNFTKSYNQSATRQIITYLKAWVEVLEPLYGVIIEKEEIPSRVYFPILRNISSFYDSVSTNGLNRITEDIFKYSTMQNYQISEKEINKLGIEIETGLDLYENIRSIRNSERKIRKDFERFETFLSNTFFNGKPVDIVAKDDRNSNDKVIIFSIGEQEYKIHDLGDGIQAVILLMYRIYTVRAKSWIFIEEPELYLHPGLQRLLIDQLVNNPILRVKQLRFFITTHSNHILDYNLEQNEKFSIFSFTKTGQNEHVVSNVATPDNNLMHLLGVRNSSVVLSNSTIWVEGPTDRIIVKAILREYCRMKKIRIPVEGYDFSFIEYAGSNLVHYLFDKDTKLSDKIIARFISNRIFVLADRDAGKDEKHANYISQQSDLFRYHVLKVREIENIASTDHMKIIIRELFLLDSESIDKANLNQSHYMNSYLGKYLQGKFPRKIRKSIAAASGTLSNYYKNRFADVFSESITGELLSNSAIELGGVLVRFVQRQ